MNNLWEPARHAAPAVDRSGEKSVLSRRRARKHERGATIVIVALSLTALISVCGLAVDESEIWIAKQRGQAIADAAALAAVRTLPATTPANIASSQTLANQIISASNVTGWTFNKADTWYSNPTSITYDDGSTQTLDSGYAVQIKGYVLAPSPFAAMLGHHGTAGNNYNKVPVTATAIAQNAAGPINVLPFGAVADQGSSSDPTLQYLASLLTGPPLPGSYSSYTVTLKDDSNGGSSIQSSGNFGAISMPGEHGANDYRDDIANDSSSSVNVGDWIDTKPGNMVGPTQQGLTSRLSSDNIAKDHYFSSYDEWFFGRSSYPIDTSMPSVSVNGVAHPYYQDPYRQDPKDAHVGIVPLISAPGKGGRAQVQILGFAAFFIQNPEPDGSGSVVTGNFIGITVPGIAGTDDGGGGVFATRMVGAY